MLRSKLPRRRRVLMLGALATLLVAASASLVVANTSDPITTSRYAVVLDGAGSEVFEFTELREVSSSVALVEGAKSRTALKPGPVRIVLRRPFTGHGSLEGWHTTARDGDMAARRSFSLVMYSPDGEAVVRYHLENGWPSELKVVGLREGTSEALVQEVTFTADDIAYLPG